MNKSLVELVNEVSEIEQLLLESGGEITPELEARLAEVDVSFPEKIDSYAWRIDRLSHISAFYLERSKEFLKVSDQLKKAMGIMRDNLKGVMASNGADSLQGNDVTFRLQKSTPSVVIDDESRISGEYIISETVTKIDKRQIAAHIKVGIEVNGAHLEETKTLRTYVGGSKFITKKQE